MPSAKGSRNWKHLRFRSEQQLEYKRIVTNPPKRIREKGLLDPVAAIRLEIKDPRRRNSHAFGIDEKGAIKVSPDTPRSAQLTALVKNKDKSPQSNARKWMPVPLSLCVSRKIRSSAGLFECRPFTYAELTWILRRGARTKR